MKDTKEYRQQSKDRLKKIIDKKIETTMIGSWVAVENKLKELVEDYPELNDTYNELRQTILDLGNQQRRNAATEIDQYDVFWNRYQLNLPVVRRIEQ